MLFSIRQKNQDLLTQLAVSVQGYLALDVIRRNNIELIKGVQRATTTTISALRTAVIVAQALADQKLVLDQITALNTTTSNLIESTSEMLHQQSGKINEQAASSTVELDEAPGGIQQHLRHDGRDRHLQGEGPRLDAEDRDRAVGRDHEVAVVPRSRPRERDARPHRSPGTDRGEPIGSSPPRTVVAIARRAGAAAAHRREPGPRTTPNTLTVMAGSEVKDLDADAGRHQVQDRGRR